MDLEEDQSNFRANKVLKLIKCSNFFNITKIIQNVTRQREFQNEDGPFDKEKWNTRLKKNNFKVKKILLMKNKSSNYKNIECSRTRPR